MYRKNGIQLIVLDRRINFMEHMNVEYKTKSGNWFNTSWFCWKLLEKDLNFESIKKEDLQNG